MPDTTKTLTYLIISECKPVDREARFDAMLDECFSFESIGGPFAYMQPSAVLKEMDEIAYRCGVNDMEDAEEWVEIEGEYYERADVEKVIEDAKDELESEISDLEDELLEAELNSEEAFRIQEKLAAKRADLKAVDTFLE